MRFFFCFDASPEIGLGHARRCGVLAQHMVEAGHEAYFAVRVRGITQLPIPDGVTVAELPWDHGVEDLLAFCRHHGLTCGVVDHYRQTEAYQQALLQSGIKWMQFYNPSVEMPFCGHLLHWASEYPGTALLPAGFEAERKTMSPWENRQDILITFGGGQDCGGINLAHDLLDQAGWSGRRLVLTTSMNPGRHAIRKGEIILDNFHPAPLMATCKAAICAAGTTLFELAALGVPAFIVTIADNQQDQAERWEASGLGAHLGRIGSRLKPLDARHLPRWSDACLRAVDGSGTTRTADALISLHSNETAPTGYFIKG